MIGAVIDDVLQHLPANVGLVITATILLLDRAIHSFWTQSGELFAHLAFQFGPLLASCVYIRKAVRLLEVLRFFTFQSCDPNALGGADVRDGVPYGTEAAPHGTCELLGRYRTYSVEHPVARPVVVVDEEAEIVVGHKVQFRTLAYPPNGRYAESSYRFVHNSMDAD